MFEPEKKIEVKFGRPTKYSFEVIKATEEYLSLCSEKKETPFYEELALKLGVGVDTMRIWADKYEEFKIPYRQLKEFQKLDIKRKGLKGQYASRMAALLLSAEHDVVPVMRKEVSGVDGKAIEVESKLSPEQEKKISDGIVKLVEEQMK